MHVLEIMTQSIEGSHLALSSGCIPIIVQACKVAPEVTHQYHIVPPPPPTSLLQPALLTLFNMTLLDDAVVKALEFGVVTALKQLLITKQLLLLVLRCFSNIAKV